ncbi:MAG TPA: hypothetical protein VHL55_03085 [Acidimicrobiia bacterium]|nr:hypothetical protein [Acidimicrobiia bacterium]
MIEPPSELRVVWVHSGAVIGGSKSLVLEEGIEVVVRVEELAGGVEVGVVADVGGVEAATTAVRGR